MGRDEKARPAPVEESARQKKRAAETLRKMLNTPPQPKTEAGKKKDQKG